MIIYDRFSKENLRVKHKKNKKLMTWITHLRAVLVQILTPSSQFILRGNCSVATILLTLKTLRILKKFLAQNRFLPSQKKGLFGRNRMDLVKFDFQLVVSPSRMRNSALGLKFMPLFAPDRVTRREKLGCRALSTNYCDQGFIAMSSAKN
jgi:hypothetical protein